MSNQIVISSGAKVRNLSGVLTGTSGIVSSVPLGAANGVATLDSLGKVPLSQLPASVVTYLGTWNASTNTPTLANGTGDTGDLYICNVAGTVNFGAGPITFAVGDWVIYSGTTWERSAGASGTVTSVAVTESGDALSITGSPITTSGTINIGFAGNSGQYINGEGNLTTFPTIISEAQNLISEVYNETGVTLTKGTIVYINGGHGNLPTVTKAIATGDSTSAQTYGVVRANISNNNNGYVTVFGSLTDIDTQAYAAGTQLYLSGTTAGAWTSTKPSAPIHLVYVGIVVRSHPTQGVVEIRIQNGYELSELHDVAISSVANNDGIFYNSSNDLWENKTIGEVLGYTPANDSLVVHLAGTETITGFKTFTNGVYIASAGGSNQLTSFVNTSSLHSGSTGLNVFGFNGSNNIYFGKGLTNGGVFLWTNSEVRYYTLPDANGTLALTSQIPTNPVGGTGTTNTLPKFTAASTIGNSNITDTGTLITLGSNSYVNGALGIGSTSLTSTSFRVSKNITGSTISYGVVNDGQIQSGVTSNAVYYQTNANTAAASFTLNNIYHNYLSQGTFGAGSTVTNQYGVFIDASLTGATNNYGFYGNIAAATNRWNLYMNGTANNYMAGNTGIGNSPNFVSAGPILTTTLTNGGSGYVDGTYTDVASSNISSNGVYALFTIVVSGGIVTTATLTWGGTTYRAGDTITVSNTLLGGTGSGLVITIDTVDSSQLVIASATGGDITLYRNDTTSAVGENIGTIKWESRDSSAKSSGIGAEISAFSAGTLGGAYLSFSTRSVSAGTSLVEAMRIDSRGGVGIGATVLTQYGLKVAKNITGAVTSYGISSEGVIQSDAITNGWYYNSTASTAAASFTVGNIVHYFAQQGTFGAGSTVTNQFGFFAAATLTGATNDYGFYGDMAAATNVWNLYMNGTASNYLNGKLLIGSTTDSGEKLQVTGTVKITGAATFSSSVRAGSYFQANDGTRDFYFNPAADFGAGSLPTIQVASNHALQFATNNSLRMSITSSGNVGIGTSSPDDSLQVASANYRGLTLSTATSGNRPTITFRNTSGNDSSYIQGDGRGIAFGALNSDYGGHTERMRITSGGDLLVGTTTDSGQKLQVNGEVYSKGDGAILNVQARDLSLYYGFFGSTSSSLNFWSSTYGVAGTFSPTTGVYTPTSDINKKKDFEASTIGLNAILGLKPTLYRMKLDDANSPKQLGFIAQEVKEFIPQAYVESDDMIGLSDRPIIAALVKAVQEQQAQIEELKALINK